MKPSPEQQKIVNYMRKHNVIVDAVAGSGKTTTILSIAKEIRESILLLTYNKKLKFETRERKNREGLDNLEVHSYHSFCSKYYGENCKTDIGIKKIISDNKKFNNFAGYDIIILDEAQDMTEIYYTIVLKILKDNNEANPWIEKFTKICLFGDKFQNIFTFNNADDRFLRYADRLFPSYNYEWRHATLSVSFRMTIENAKFINSCALKMDRILSQKHGPKPDYYICNMFDETKLYDIIKKYLNIEGKTNGLNYSDTFILAPSVRNSKTPIIQLANLLSKKGIPIYVPTSDEEELDDDILKGKVVFSTFHQTKGLERKLVIIFNFDDSYFKYYDKNANINICPNVIYVALTRAIDKIVLLHHCGNNYLPFLNTKNIQKICEYYKLETKPIKNNEQVNNAIDTSVTDVTRHLPIEIINNALKYLKLTNISQKMEAINIPIKTKQDDLWEAVSEITGTAIPAYFQYKKTGKMEITNQTIENLEPETLLKLTNEYCSKGSGHIFKLVQIKNYDWLTQENLDDCCSLLSKFVSNDAMFECRIDMENVPELGNRKLIGYIDCVDGDNIYEFKCTKELEDTHILQLALYKYILELQFCIKKYKLQYQGIAKIKPLADKLKIIYKNMYNISKNNLEIGDTIEFILNSEKHIGTVYGKCKNGTLKIEIENYQKKKVRINNTDNFKIICKVLSNETLIDKNYLETLIKDIKKEHNLISENEQIENNEQIANDDSFMLSWIPQDYTIKHKYFLLNILNGQMIQIESNIQDLRKMVEYVIKCKYYNDDVISDNQFIDKMSFIRDKWDSSI